jgi:hypothetical protein
MPSPQYFTVKLLTKPYLKKYLQALYGDPLIFTSKNFFGSILIGLLDKTSPSGESKKVLRLRLDKFTTSLVVYCPMWFLKEHKYGFNISEAHMIAMNKLFEQRFTEDLFKFCHVLNMCGIDLEDALEEFCKQYNIELDVDATMDGLKQKEYRYRKHLTDIDAGITKPKIKPIQLSFLAVHCPL